MLIPSFCVCFSALRPYLMITASVCPNESAYCLRDCGLVQPCGIINVAVVDVSLPEAVLCCFCCTRSDSSCFIVAFSPLLVFLSLSPHVSLSPRSPVESPPTRRRKTEHFSFPDLPAPYAPYDAPYAELLPAPLPSLPPSPPPSPFSSLASASVIERASDAIPTMSAAAVSSTAAAAAVSAEASASVSVKLEEVAESMESKGALLRELVSSTLSREMSRESLASSSSAAAALTADKMMQFVLLTTCSEAFKSATQLAFSNMLVSSSRLHWAPQSVS